MQLTRDEAISCLLEEESVEIHKRDPYELNKMSKYELMALLNKVFEPIDLDDPYTVEEFVISTLN
jgi:hypothetical protein